MDKSFLFSTVAILIAICTFLVTFFSYKRNRILENENHLYKIKMDKCHLLLDKIVEFLLLIDNAFILADEYIKNPTSEKKDALLVASTHLDNETLKFSLFIASHSLTMPKVVVNELEKLIDYLLEADVEEGLNSEQDKIVDKCYDLANGIQVLMRKDLNIDALNFSLFKRIDK